MKIAYIVCRFPPYAGGMGVVAYEQVKRLAQQGHQVTVFTLSNKPRLDPKKLPFDIKYLKAFPRLGNAGFSPELFWQLRHYDVIQLHYPFYGAQEVIWLGKISGLYKKSKNAESSGSGTYLMIEATEGAQKDKAFVAFGEGGSPGFENGADISKLFGSVNSPQLYMISEDVEYSVNYLSSLELGEERTVPLSFVCGLEGEQQFKFTLNQLEETIVSFEDTQTGEFIEDLSETSNYSFTSLKEDSADRFLLHFTNLQTGNEETIQKNEEFLSVYSYEEAVYIRNKKSNNSDIVKIFIYDMFGRQIYFNQTHLDNMIRIPVNVNNNYLVVKVIRENQIFTEKVFIK